jgi:predicted glycosyltransferase
MADQRRPTLLLHCQHSLGLGHLVRSFALAEALAEQFHVTILCGGELPDSLPRPGAVEIVPLPPLGAERGELVSRDPALGVARVLELRRERVLDAFRKLRPAVVVVELFPFGRKKLAHELVPLLEAARATGAVTVASVRDLLVGRVDHARHDERASEIANRLLDAILVHADPRFARLEETFQPRTPLHVPVHHTGFVVRATQPARLIPAKSRVVVSVGGGRVGTPLLRAAVDAQRLLGDCVATTLVAGPFLPSDQWSSLRELANGAEGVMLRRTVPDLGAELAAASASVSQCGYNTALDVVRSGVPALVVPFAEPGEDEQTQRAQRLARLGAVRLLEPSGLSGPRLAREIEDLLRFRPAPPAFDLDGAAESARLLAALVRKHSMRGAA